MNIQTRRLALRPFQVNDNAALFEIQSNAGAMRFTNTAPSIKACRERRLKQVTH